MRFRDRSDAGRQLAQLLSKHTIEHAFVLGLVRGGVPVAFEIARALKAPLDIWVVRKIGVPFQPELGLGAVSEGGGLYRNEDVIESVGFSPVVVDRLIAEKAIEVGRNVELFRHGRPPPELGGRSVILVDDGIATGGTIHAAVRAIRARGPSRITLATGVAPPSTLDELQAEVDEIVCVQVPSDMMAIGQWYVDFSQVQDQEVLDLLARSGSLEPAGAH
jgi:putative phosphoribosyl transferase